jgi:TetR/AcrR family tetracycline transcriptional repressor
VTTGIPKTPPSVPRRGRPPVLDREKILEAAGGIGVGDFTLPAVADCLGVSPQALYHYFPNRESLLEALADASLRHVPMVPDRGQGWREHVRETAVAVRAVLLRTPGAAERIGAGRQSPEALRRMEHTVGVLMRRGFTAEEALRSCQLVTNYVLRSSHIRLRQHPRSRYAAARELAEGIEYLGNDALPHLTAVLDTLVTLDPDETFERNLDCILAGIAAVYGH